MLNIWLVTIGEPLPTEAESKKLRTAVLADRLLEKGHAVVSFVSAFDHLKKKWIYENDTNVVISEKYHLQVLKGKGYERNISLRRFADHRIIVKKFKEIAPQMTKPDIIVASMPPHDLAYEVVEFARRNNIPVLVDIRDPWPDIFLQAFPKQLSGIFKLIFYKEFHFIRKTMQRATGLLATAGTLLDWGLAYAKRQRTDRDKVFYLSHKKVVALDEGGVNKKFIETAKALNNKFILFFVGTVAHYHNPLIIVETAKRLKDNKNIHFVIAGDGELLPELERQSEGLSNVTLTGWLNQKEIEFWLKKSKAGLCTTPKFVDILPNKAGTYLSANLPLISSFQGDLKLIIEKENIGFYYSPNDVSEFVDCILKLSGNQSRYNEMSANAGKAFDLYFDADKVYDNYAKHIEFIAANYKAS